MKPQVKRTRPRRRGKQAATPTRDDCMTTRLDKAIGAFLITLALLVLAAVLNIYLASPPVPAASSLPSAPATDVALWHQHEDAIKAAGVKVAQAKAQAALDAIMAEQAAVAKAQQARAAAVVTAPQPPPVSYGVMSCAAVEQLWDSAGGSPALAVTMASIAGAESSRNPDAPDGGLWQIQGGQPVPGNIDDPVVNAENAVYKETNSGLSQWTTYTSGVYLTRDPC